MRSAELRGLRAEDLRRPRVNGRHHRLFVRGEGGRGREVPVPRATQQALEAWIAVHPLARGVALLDERPLFVRLGRHGGTRPLPLSAIAVHRIVRRFCLAAGVPDRLAHPQALRAYWATRGLEAAVPACGRPPSGLVHWEGESLIGGRADAREASAGFMRTAP